MSKLVDQIKNKVKKGLVKQPFSVADLGGILKKSPSFLSKHRKGNPGNYTPYFTKVSRGKYKL